MKDYKESGVDINEGYRTVELIRKHTKRTMIPGVLNDIGGFAGMFELKNYKNPILVSGTDGVFWSPELTESVPSLMLP